MLLVLIVFASIIYASGVVALDTTLLRFAHVGSFEAGCAVVFGTRPRGLPPKITGVTDEPLVKKLTLVLDTIMPHHNQHSSCTVLYSFALDFIFLHAASH